MNNPWIIQGQGGPGVFLSYGGVSIPLLKRMNDKSYTILARLCSEGLSNNVNTQVKCSWENCSTSNITLACAYTGGGNCHWTVMGYAA